MRYNNLNKCQKVIFNTLTIVGIIAAIYYIFNFCIKGYIMMNHSYYFLLIGIFLTNGFLILPARKKDNKKLPWYDILAACCCFSIVFYFFVNSYSIIQTGWVPPPSKYDVWLASILIILILESARRMGGFAYFVISLTMGLYPFYANFMPGIFYGNIFPFNFVVSFYVFGNEGILGLPSKVVGEILIGFIIFSGALIGSGAGEFFLDMAYATFGKFRGGLSKVAVIFSGLFGTMTGSAISNVAATGSITIPAMIKSGYSPYYASALIACASTGGCLMPPIMGSVAFVMCTILNVSYATIVKAAIIPAFLYYMTLFIYTDFYSAKNGLKGVSKESLPSFLRIVKGGWIYLSAILFIIWGLLYMRWDRYTPFYAAFLLFILSFFKPEKSLFNYRNFINCISSMGKIVTQTIAIILPVGLIIGGLGLSGVSLSITSGVVRLGGDKIVFIILLGILTTYIMGMAGMLVSAYVFLSITFAPAIIKIGGLNTIAVHMFIMYYCMIAVITPPVASCAFVAANIADTNGIKTAWTASKIGFSLYVIPFYFLFNPALLMIGSVTETFFSVLACAIGLILIVGAFEGYLPKLGHINLLDRIFLFIGGFLIPFFERTKTSFGIIISLVIIFHIIFKKFKLKK